MLPTFQTYGNYSSTNYGAHALMFQTNQEQLWFSYKTLVAFCRDGETIIVRENDWGPTTGKHLNAIDGGSKEAKKKRLSSQNFEDEYYKKSAFIHGLG
jgi:hypothetical protein